MGSAGHHAQPNETQISGEARHHIVFTPSTREIRAQLREPKIKKRRLPDFLEATQFSQVVRQCQTTKLEGLRKAGSVGNLFHPIFSKETEAVTIP